MDNVENFFPYTIDVNLTAQEQSMKLIVVKELWLAIKIVITLSVFSILYYFISTGRLDWDLVKDQLFYNTYYGLPLCFVNGWFLTRLDRYIKWESSPIYRIWVGIIGCILVTMVTLIILNYILWVRIDGNELRVLYDYGNRQFYAIALFITVIVSSVLHAVSFYSEVQKQKKMNQRLREEKIISELNALRAHLDPHFLFNSFNVLSGLIDEDKNQAQDFLSGLSTIYRYILDSREEELRSIKDELTFAKKYLNLHLARFENSISLEVDIPEKYHHLQVPSLSLQLLLENAIKHNAFDEESPLVITIKVEEDMLVVENNKKSRTTLYENGGLGLKNIQDRYLLLGKRKMTIRDTLKSFTVNLPILNQ